MKYQTGLVRRSILCGLVIVCWLGAISADDGCTIPGYDTKVLTGAPYWSFQSDAFCLDSWKTSPNCTFYMSFCKTLNFPSPCNDAGVCQMDKTNPSIRAKQYKLGGNESVPHFTKYKSGKVGFVARFSPGMIVVHPENNATLNTSVDVHFSCNQSILWSPAAPNSIPGSKSVHLKLSANSLKYTIQLQYPGACAKIVPIGPNITPTLPYLSAGTVILIVAFSGLFLYCTLGCLVNVCRGRKGVDVVPNNETWTQLPDNLQDGCAFFWACICCQKKKSTEPLPQFQGYDSI